MIEFNQGVAYPHPIPIHVTCDNVVEMNYERRHYFGIGGAGSMASPKSGEDDTIYAIVAVGSCGGRMCHHSQRGPTTTEIVFVINIRTIIPSLKQKISSRKRRDGQEHDSKSIRVGDAIYYHRVPFSAAHRIYI